MDAEYLEVRSGSTLEVVSLTGEELTIGRIDTNGVSLPSDRLVSRLHAALKRYGGSWCLRDLGSANGTFVNGRRLTGEWTLEPGDEIMIGKTSLVFRTPTRPGEDMTVEGTTRPQLTAREHDVLVALCRPALSGEVFTEPASVRAMAEQLFITEAAVKQHLLHLYGKFGIKNTEQRRTRLANETFRRGIVTRSDLHPSDHRAE